MNYLLIRNLCIVFFALSPMLHAQWFYEMGLSRNTFDSYAIDDAANTVPLKTSFIPYKGLRDLSYNIGYLFPILAKGDPMEVDYRPPFLRLGVGIGFDQMNIRTNAIISSVKYPTNYNLAQLHARLGIHLTPVVFYSSNSGVRKPSVALTIHGGGAFNQFTSAIRQGAGTSVDLLHDSREFKDTYFSYQYGGGFQIFLNKTTQIYARYTVDDSETFVENSTRNNVKVKESYILHKNKFSLGVLVDFKLINRMKKDQQDKIKALEDSLNDTKSMFNELQAIADENARLGNELDVVKDELALLKDKQDKIDESALKTKIHETGVRYFPEFKEIRFKTNSSHFDTKSYAGMLARLGTFLTQNPQLNIQLVGYADMTGPETYNMQLSKNRAARVRDHLIEKYGVAANRIKTKAMGETNQFSLSDNSDNRRTEIIILE